MSEKSLKLVGAERYSCPLVQDGAVVEKGAIVTVSAEVAEVLEADVKIDALNNEHPVWVEVEAGEEGEDGEQKAKPAAARRAARTK